MLRAGLEATALLAFFGLCLFVPAGRISWFAGWAYLAIFAAFTAAAFVVVRPELVRERAAPGPGSDRRDALIAGIGFVGLYPGTLIVAGIDAAHGARCIPPFCQVPAFVLFAAGYGFALWAMRANPFFSTFIRIQSERGHSAVSSGPYAWVRHPGYAGICPGHRRMPRVRGADGPRGPRARRAAAGLRGIQGACAVASDPRGLVAAAALTMPESRTMLWPA
jgi:hypothetical protein